MIRSCFRTVRCRSLITMRRFASDASEKPGNPFRKIIRHRGLVYDYGEKIANRICLSVIGNGAAGQGATLCMFTDYKSYMFNCGEAVGRVFRENDLFVSDVRHVFITRREWKNISGLPDLYLSLQKVKRGKLTLHGPPHIEDFFGLTVSSEKNVRISKKPIENGVYEDEAVEIQYVTIFPSITSQMRANIRPFNHKYQRKEAPILEGSDMTVCYICKCLPKPRQLSWEKCIDLGVPPGPLLLELKNGDDVTLPCGRKVRSEEALEPEDPSMVFLVVDCPSEHFLDSLILEAKFKPYQVPVTEVPVAIVHFAPPHIFDSYKYQKWISRFSPDTLHLVLNSDNVVPSKVHVHRLQNMLNLLHPRIFKLLPKHRAEVDCPTSKNVIHAEEGLVLHLRPSVSLDRNNIAVLDPKSDIQKAKEIPGFCESLSQLHFQLQGQKNQSVGSTYPEVIFLGTGSACSSPYRACSCILVNVSAEQSVMFDCGDGTYQQLVQYFGLDDIKNVLRKLSCIFISHHHGDHYLGLFGLIKARKEAFSACKLQYIPLAITIPRLLKKVVANFENLFGPVRSDIRIFRNSGLTAANDELLAPLMKYLGNCKLQTVPVTHCEDSYGVVLTDGSSWKIVYSGDCCPSQSLVDAGKDCTLLIHEATIEDELEHEASLRRHSTISQALNVSQQMNAQHTIVTHFCRHYVEVPFIKNSYRRHSVGIAFDNMRVRLCDLPCLSLLIPTLRHLFSERLELHHVDAMGNAGFQSVTLKTLKS